MKKIILVMTALFMLSATGFAQSGTTGPLSWNISNGTLTVIGEGAMPDYFLIEDIPWYSYHSSITKVVIGDGVTSIGDWAFRHFDALTSVTIPNSVTSIGDWAFLNCDALTSVTIPNSVTSIGHVAFENCDNLTSVIIPNSVTSIGHGAFYYCSGLTSVTIGKSVTSIVNSAFSSCSALTSVTNLNPTPQSINSDVFYNVSLNNATLYVPAKSIEAYKAAEVWNEFGNIVSSPVTWDLSNGILTVSGTGTIPDYSSPDYAPWYSDRSSITTVIIEDGVTRIGNSAFEGCNEITSVTIPNSVTSIGNRGFFECRKLTSVTIPNSVTSIGDYAFSWCEGLTEITIPSSVTSIGVNAFRGCTELTSVTIGESVTSIGERAFQGCTGLTSVTNLNPTPQSINSNVFYNVDLSKVTLYVPESSIEDYKAAEVWKEFGIVSVYIPLTWDLSNGTLTISGEGAIPNYSYAYHAPWYSDRSSITTVIIENGVTSIGDLAFYECDALTSVTIPNSVTRIGYGAFHSCSSLVSVTIPNSVTSIGDSAFWYCIGLTSVTIPNSVTRIGSMAFKSCSGLTSATIGKSVTIIGDYPFSECIALTAIDVSEDNTAYASENGVLFNKEKSTLIGYPIGKQDASYNIPNSVTIIGQEAFNRCSNLTSVTIPESVTILRGGAFNRCSNLTSVTIPNSVTSIGDIAFQECTGLISVTIGNSVIRIGYSAFFECNGLTEITIPNSVTSIEKEAFKSCSNLTSVTIGNSVISIGGRAFEDCGSLTSVTNLNTTPQSINTYVFYNVELNNATLYVPASAIEDYEAAETWKDFGNIVSAPSLFYVSITTSNPSMGTVTGTGYYQENSTATITATANPGYRFVKWDDDNTQNPRTITVTQDTTYTAVFDVNTNIQQTPDNDVSIYPNPVVESFRINGITAPTEVIITDLSGRIVLQQTVEVGESVAAGNLPKGVYLVRAGGKALKVVKR